MKLKNLIFLSIIALGAIAGCSKEKIDDDQNVSGGEAFAMVYEDFITPDDVVINNADTTSITVSKKYAEKIGVKDFEGRVVSIWRSIGTAPFIRIIKDAEVKGDKVVLTTERGTAADLFEELELDFDSELYIDRDYVATKTTRGTDYEVDDVSAKYQDEEGVSHPAVIIFEDLNSEAAKDVTTKSGADVKNYFTAEELIANNFEYDLISVNSLSIKIDTTAWKSKDGLMSVHVSAKGQASAKLTLFGSLKVSAFSLKKLSFGLRGSADIKARMGTDINLKKKIEWEHSLVEMGKTTLVFWAGPFPIPLSVEPKLKYVSEIEAQANLSLYMSAKAGGEVQVGMEYDSSRKDKWKNLCYGKLHKSTCLDGIFPNDTSNIDYSEGLELKAGAGISFGAYWETGLYLAGAAGPMFSTGPKLGLEAEVSGKLDAVTCSFAADVSAAAYAAYAGEVGAKMKILGYKIAEYKYEFELLRFDFANYEGSFVYDFFKGKSEFESGWSALMMDEETWDDILDNSSSENPEGMIPPSMPGGTDK